MLVRTISLYRLITITETNRHVYLAADFLTMNGMSATVDAAAASCPLQCPEDRRQCAMDTRPAECKAADIDDETKAALCQSECLLASMMDLDQSLVNLTERAVQVGTSIGTRRRRRAREVVINCVQMILGPSVSRSDHRAVQVTVIKLSQLSPASVY